MRCKKESESSPFCILGICAETIGSVLPVRLSVGNRFAFLHDKPVERRGQERGAQGGAKLPPPTGGRGAAEGRVFWRKEHSVLFSEKKPTGTPEHPEGMIRCAARGERSSPRPPEAAERLKPERLAEPISPAEHRRTEGGSVRSKGGAKLPPPPGGRGAAEGRVFWRKEHSVLFSEKKPTGTPEHPEGMIRCAARKERYSPMMFLRVSARGRDSAGRSEASRSVQPAESSRSAASVSLPEVSVR